MLPQWHEGATEWFDEYENDVNHVLWPSQSPDLSPTERLFGLTCWTALSTTKNGVHPSSRVQRLIESMPRRKLFWWDVVAQHLTKTLYVGFSVNVSPVCICFSLCWQFKGSVLPYSMCHIHFWLCLLGFKDINFKICKIRSDQIR